MKKLNIRYYGLLTDITKNENELIEVNRSYYLSSLLSDLYERYPDFKNHSIAFFGDGNKLHNKEEISSYAEIDCMPPFSGG